jgi:hypothetical protein
MTRPGEDLRPGRGDTREGTELGRLRIAQRPGGLLLRERREHGLQGGLSASGLPVRGEASIGKERPLEVVERDLDDRPAVAGIGRLEASERGPHLGQGLLRPPEVEEDQREVEANGRPIMFDRERPPEGLRRGLMISQAVPAPADDLQEIRIRVGIVPEVLNHRSIEHPRLLDVAPTFQEMRESLPAPRVPRIELHRLLVGGLSLRGMIGPEVLERPSARDERVCVRGVELDGSFEELQSRVILGGIVQSLGSADEVDRELPAGSWWITAGCGHSGTR